MGDFAAALEPGSDDDHVVVRVDDRVRLAEEHLSIGYQVGLAWMFKVPVEPDGVQPAARLPNHGLADMTGVQVARSPSLRISVETDYMAVPAGELYRTGLLPSPRRRRIGDLTEGGV